MKSRFEDLYDYDALRKVETATAFVVQIERPVLVLGGSQADDVLMDGVEERIAVRRRRGGGGLVLLQHDDLWIDWWLPRSDERAYDDVTRNALRAGEWWYRGVRSMLPSPPSIVGSGMSGAPALRVACFAGGGPGELFYESRKLVGVTQWSVREGVFLSTLLPAHPTRELTSFLAAPPDGLSEALDEAWSITELNLLDQGNDIVDAVIGSSAPVIRRNLYLQA